MVKVYGLKWNEDKNMLEDYLFFREMGFFFFFWNLEDMLCFVCNILGIDMKLLMFCLVYNDLFDLVKCKGDLKKRYKIILENKSLWVVIDGYFKKKWKRIIFLVMSGRLCYMMFCWRYV